MAENTEFDIRGSADGVVRQLRDGEGEAALAQLEQLRDGKPLVVQEALDRYVAALGADSLRQLREAAPDAASVRILDRLDSTTAAPRMPPQAASVGGMNEAPLTEAQRHDVYASMVYTRGNEAARTALESGDRVLLGLRDENTSLATMESRESPGALRVDDAATPDVNEAQAGRGVYNDRLVVLWRDGATRGVHESHRANTEPTALYDEHARPGDGQASAYAHVSGWRKAEGEDVNGDGIRDLGRLAEATFEMKRATHGSDNHDAFRPTTEAVRNGAGQVRRDTNADGRFDSGDAGGVQDLNDTFKIHRGSRGATDSAGCQTLHPDDFRGFMDAAQGREGQERWQYVLTETRGAPARIQEALPQSIQTEPTRSGLSPQSRGLLDDSLSQVRRIAREHGLTWDAGLANTACAVACGAREAGMSGVNLLNVRDGLVRFGHRDGVLLNDGAIDARLAANTPAAESLQRMAGLDMAQTSGERSEVAAMQTGSVFKPPESALEPRLRL
jgi:hypothetical protein